MSQRATPKSLDSLDGTFGWKAPGSQVDLKDIIQQLQGFRISWVDGGNQSAALSVKMAGGLTGSAAKICPDDVLLGVVSWSIVAASGLTDMSLRRDARIVSTGNIRFSSAATTNMRILVFWWDTSGYVSNA